MRQALITILFLTSFGLGYVAGTNKPVLVNEQETMKLINLKHHYMLRCIGLERELKSCQGEK